MTRICFSDLEYHGGLYQLVVSFFLLQRALLSKKSCNVPHRDVEKVILKVLYVLAIVDSDCCDQTRGAKNREKR
jgi:hypothetical protein